MPHTNRLSRLRMTYTGEPYRLALHNINTVIGSSPIPEAANYAQRELEACVLLALREARQYCDQSKPGYPFSYVAPKPNTLEVKLQDHALHSLAYSLAPVRASQQILGVPGLRATYDSRGVTLHLLNEHGRLTPGSILLKGVTKDQWTEAMIWTREQSTDSRAAQRFLAHEPTLTVVERRALRRGRTPVNPRLASLLLRRLNILRSACWIDTWTSSSVVKIEWCDGPPLDETARLLARADLGILESGISLREYDQLISQHEIHSLNFEVSIRSPNQRKYRAGGLVLRQVTHHSDDSTQA